MEAIAAPTGVMTPEAIRRAVAKMSVFGDTIIGLLGVAQRITLMAEYQHRYQPEAEDINFTCIMEKLKPNVLYPPDAISVDGNTATVVIAVSIEDIVDNTDDLYALRTVVEKAQEYEEFKLIRVDDAYVADAVFISDMDCGFNMPNPRKVGWSFEQYDEDDDEDFDDEYDDADVFDDDEDYEQEDEDDGDDGYDSYERREYDEPDERCELPRELGTYVLDLTKPV